LQFVKEIDHEIAKKNLPLEHRASQREWNKLADFPV
jgi:hypothetical protein